MADRALLLLNMAGIARTKMDRIAQALGDTKAVLTVSGSELKAAGSLSDRDVERIITFRDSGALDEELAQIEKNDIRMVSIFDDEYPSLLKEIYHPPLVLYVKGDIGVCSEFCFAVVGARLATLYGVSMAEKFAYGLAALGMTIVSGLARGIDRAAHKGALMTGRTVAVLGSGMLNIYPREHGGLARDIVRQGAVITEFPLYHPPLRENFPRRNRIISGLCRGVLIIEAAARSGALITARTALEQNREVFALPGRADSPLSMGTHALIKQGARLVDSIEDIPEEFGLTVSREQLKTVLSAEETEILDLINTEGVYLEEILLRAGKERGAIHRALITLQMKGLIEERTPLLYTKKHGVGVPNG